MVIKEAGHVYELQNLKKGRQTLKFITKQPAGAGVEGPVRLETTSDGTTNEEVLKALIDRMRYLQKRLPSRETALATMKLEEALMWLEKRTADRTARGVVGTNAA